MARLAGMTLRERWSDWQRAVHRRQQEQHLGVAEGAIASRVPGLRRRPGGLLQDW
jgi:hypothetical protein